jgi:hypothetical protein
MGSLKLPASVAKHPVVREAWFRVRRLQARRRVLPDFLIIGAQKGGTTSLYDYLGQHPQIARSLRKEINFFTGGPDPEVDLWRLGEGWYRAHFPLRAKMAPGQKAFEASPDYMLHPLAAGRIAGLLPDVKLVAMLRNPTDRAISHYFHNVREGEPARNGETLPIGAAMAAEEARMAPILAAEDYRCVAFRALSYKLRGHYADQLARYLALFPRENLLVLRAEDLFEDPDGLMARLFAFLDVAPNLAALQFAARNVGFNARPVDPAVRESLDAYFAPLNRRLYELIGEDFGW